MNDGKVVVLTCTPEPERICAAAARISTTVGVATDIYEATDNDIAAKLIPKVLKLGHKSFIEHACFSIAFENVSAFVEQFMIEFRLASFTIKSRRYVDFSKVGYYIPSFRFHSDISQTEQAEISEKYLQQMDFLFGEYEYFVAQGVPKEDARFMLPYSYKSNFYCTVNARELIHIIYSAIYGRASRFTEVKLIGESLLEQVKDMAPNVFSNPQLLEEGREDKEFRLKDLLNNIDVKDKPSKGITELLSFSKNADRVVATATIVNHTLCSTDAAEQLLDNDSELFDKILEVVCDDKRRRELEQVSFTFRINNLSLAGLTHLVRHRIQSINIPSFTEFGKSDFFIVPESISKEKPLLERYQKVLNRHNSLFRDFEKIGVVKEDLVYLYLSGNVVDVITTMNARELLHFIQLRTCNRAQWEIRQVAIHMLKQLRNVAPRLFSKFGPSCFVKDKCPEAKLSCGQMAEVREIFRRIR